MLWEVLSRYRGSDSSGIDCEFRHSPRLASHESAGPALSDHLKVPLPFLLYRAQVRYEEDLRVLQGNLGASTAIIPPRPRIDTKVTERAVTAPSSRVTPVSLKPPSIPPLSRQTTPIATPRNRLATQLRSPHGLQESQLLLRHSPISASTATLQSRPPTTRPVSSSPLTIRRAITPPSPPSPSASSEEGDEDAAKKEDNREEVDRQLKTLEKMMSSQLLGFARPKIDPSKARERLNSSMIKASQRTESPKDKTTPTSSIPSIPSPPPESPGTNVSSPSSARAPTALLGTRPAPHVVRNKLLGKTAAAAANERRSNHGSSTSSFSDLSGMVFDRQNSPY